MPCLPGVFLRRSGVKSRPGAHKTETDYVCVREEISDLMIQAHFEGRQALAISPFLSDGKSCQWLVIDIDRYGIALDQLMAHVKISLPIPLPMVPAATKSGGWHLFLFLDAPAASGELHTLANKIRFWLNGGALHLQAIGQPGEIEVRPAQPMIDVANGDVGNFITLPLFNSTPEEREAFLTLAESSRIDDVQLNTLIDEKDLMDGPCCLFPLQKKAERDGWHHRNLFVYQLSVFFKKKYPTDWKERVHEYNTHFINPSLDAQEIDKTLQSAEKTSMHYICNKDPFEGVCNKTLCQRRRFGVAARGVLEFINPDGLTIIESDPPVWFLTVYAGNEEVRMKLSTEELQSVRKFKKRCIEVLKTIPSLPSEKQWEATINDWLSRATLIPIPYEMGEQNKLWDLIWRFYSSSSTTTTPLDLFHGKIFIESTPDNGSYAYFRLIDFNMYIERVRAKMPPTSVFAMLKEMELSQKVQLAVVKLEGFDMEVWRAQIPDHYLLQKMESNLRGDDYA